MSGFCWLSPVAFFPYRTRRISEDGGVSPRPGRALAGDLRAGGYLLAPDGEEYIGDVLNVTFSCGWIVGEEVPSIATSTVERLVDYCRGTPPDA